MNAIAKHDQQNLIPAGDAPMVAMIERIAMDPNIPLERLEQMLAMKERMEDRAREDEDRQARKSFFAAMSVCQAEIPVVAKKRKNSHTNSMYADLAAIEEQAMPVIHRHGFAVSFQPDGYNEKGELRILWEISHQEGHSRSGVGEIPVDGAGTGGKVNKTGTQAFGSTATYGRRYLLCMLFNISTGDDMDGNAPKDMGGAITADQAKEIRDKIDAVGADIERFCNRWEIEAVTNLPASRFRDVMISLDRFAEQKKQRESQEA